MIYGSKQAGGRINSLYIKKSFLARSCDLALFLGFSVTKFGSSSDFFLRSVSHEKHTQAILTTIVRYFEPLWNQPQ